jgi:hypothetical protein
MVDESEFAPIGTRLLRVRKLTGFGTIGLVGWSSWFLGGRGRAGQETAGQQQDATAEPV